MVIYPDFFKKNYGMSFADYLTNVRLHHAVDQLLYTDIPITRIVYDNGFSSVALFNKAFKKEYGETPSAVRKRGAGNKKTKQHTITKEMEKKAGKCTLERQWAEDRCGYGKNKWRSFSSCFKTIEQNLAEGHQCWFCTRSAPFRGARTCDASKR